jgi:hypothetical protein
MLSEAAQSTQTRHQLWLVFAVWLLASLIMISHAIPNLMDWKFTDPDDAMRLLEVRDWLAGQSWFDVTQYRLNAPQGGPMHWSRYVDLPIAATILIARQFVGQHGAETAALIAVPLLTLGVAMVVMHRIALKLMDPPSALLAVIATPLSLGAMTQMKIMRIDHHGWQIVLAMTALLATLDSRGRRGGIIAGAAVGLWLNISIEGLPFAAALGVLFGLEWLLNPSAGERLKAYLAALASASALFFAATHLPSAWFDHPHDVLNVAHLAGFAVAWLCCRFAVQKRVTDWRFRLALLGTIGCISLAAMFAVDPHFLQPPFASLDPLVRDAWYLKVKEGQPIWALSRYEAAISLAQPLVGLAGALLAIRLTRGEERRRWLLFTYILVEATLAGVFVIREVTAASLLSLPGTAFLCATALSRARKCRAMPIRTVATTAALLIMAPAYAAPALFVPTDKRLTSAWDSSFACQSRAEVEKLNALPPSNLAVPLDITPAILASTPHRAIASGYHRNVSGIHDVIALFSGQIPEARAILARRHIDYLVFCPYTPEAQQWAARGPNGLSAMLDANRAPDWLQPVHIPGLRALKVWRVRDAASTAVPNG